MAHGIYITEAATSLITPSQVNTVTVAVGTAPVHKAIEGAALNEAVVAYRYSEAVKSLGYSEDFESYTLCEVMKVFFSLYSIAPAVFINVLDPARHFNLIEKEIAAGKAAFEGDIDITSFKVTSGAVVPLETFEKGIDFEVRIDEVEDLDLEETLEIPTLHILNGDKVIDNKIKVFYRLSHEALGGHERTTEVTLSNALWYELPEDTLIDSVRVESGGSDDLVELVLGEDYGLKEVEGGVEFDVLKRDNIVDNKVNISYHEIDPTKVTAADVIGGVSAAGESFGLELIEGIHGKYNLIPATIIAPKFSLDLGVVGALTSKAKKISGIFPAMAIADISTENKTYLAAIEAKGKLTAESNLILCYPKIKTGDEEYYMSTHLAALMAQVDSDHEDIPYASPSNHTLQMNAAVVAGGTEIYLDRDQANLLNDNGIVTAFSFNGWRAYGNYTSLGDSGDIKDKFIPIRRMFHFLSNYIATTYISQLDLPLTRRQIDSIINSANIYLNGLTNKGAIIGGRLELAEENNAVDLMNGKIYFHLYFAPPSPMQSLVFTLEYDTSYVEQLLS